MRARTELPGVASIKIPGVPADPNEDRAHVQAIRGVVPAEFTIGVSGDALAAAGLLAGCDAWYSVIGGTLPEAALAITRAAQGGRAADALTESARLEPLWQLFEEHGGSYRVVAALAEHLGLVQRPITPLPILGLDDAERARLAEVIAPLLR